MVVGQSSFHPLTLYSLPTEASRSLLRHCIWFPCNSPSPVGLDANFAGSCRQREHQHTKVKNKALPTLQLDLNGVLCFCAFRPYSSSFMDLVQFNIQPVVDNSFQSYKENNTALHCCFLSMVVSACLSARVFCHSQILLCLRVIVCERFSLVHGLNGNCSVCVFVCVCRGLLTKAVIHKEVWMRDGLKSRQLS